MGCDAHRVAAEVWVRRREFLGNASGDVSEDLGELIIPDHYSIAPLAGSFLSAVGMAMVLGGLLPRHRNRLLVSGFLMGTVVTFVCGDLLYVPPPPTGLQVGCLVGAVALEAIAFIVLMPRLHQSGPRAAVAGTLAIVGAHFLFMAPALGPGVLLLGVLACLNAAAVWRVQRYPLDAGWFVDGILKVAVGIGMMLTFRF